MCSNARRERHLLDRCPRRFLAANADTLRRLGPRQFSLTAVAEAAEVSRGTVHNALGSRDNAIRIALEHLASTFVDAMATEVDRHDTLAEQVGAAAVLICAHRQRSDHVDAARRQREHPAAAAPQQR